MWFQNRRQQWRISHGSSEYEAGVRKMKVESGDVDLEKILFNLKLRDGGDANSPGVEEEETQSAGGPSYHSSPMMGHYDQ